MQALIVPNAKMELQLHVGRITYLVETWCEELV
jgi:hypothetical protein